jgi:hypothetical protein
LFIRTGKDVFLRTIPLAGGLLEAGSFSQRPAG